MLELFCIPTYLLVLAGVAVFISGVVVGGIAGRNLAKASAAHDAALAVAKLRAQEWAEKTKPVAEGSLANPEKTP